MAVEPEDDQHSPLVDLSAFQRDVLVVARDHEDGPIGLDIMRDLEAAGWAEVQHGRLYPNLDELVEKGLLSKKPKDKRSNRYEITDRGRREIQHDAEWRLEDS